MKPYPFEFGGGWDLLVFHKYFLVKENICMVLLALQAIKPSTCTFLHIAKHIPKCLVDVPGFVTSSIDLANCKNERMHMIIIPTLRKGMKTKRSQLNLKQVSRVYLLDLLQFIAKRHRAYSSSTHGQAYSKMSRRRFRSGDVF